MKDEAAFVTSLKLVIIFLLRKVFRKFWVVFLVSFCWLVLIVITIFDEGLVKSKVKKFKKGIIWLRFYRKWVEWFMNIWKRSNSTQLSIFDQITTKRKHFELFFEFLFFFFKRKTQVNHPTFFIKNSQTKTQVIHPTFL